MTLQIDVTKQQIGAPIPGLDGAIYIGIAPAEGDMPQAHLVLWKDSCSSAQDFETSVAFAKAVDPATDSHLPTSTESALLYATVRDQIKKDDWYWTSTYYNEDKDAAFVQLFSDGDQSYTNLTLEFRALAVSRLPL